MIGVSEEELQRDRERLLNFIKETHVLIISLYPMTCY